MSVTVEVRQSRYIVRRSGRVTMIITPREMTELYCLLAPHAELEIGRRLRENEIPGWEGWGEEQIAA